MSGPVFLIPEQPNHELVKVLHGLLDLAKRGEMNGMVFGASFRGQKYYCDAAGALHRNSVVGLGVACMLKTELERKMQQRATDTVV